MKKYLLIGLTTLLCMACTNKQYEINGTFSNDSFNGQYIFLTLASDTQTKLDSALISNNSFTMKGKIDSVEICYLKASNIKTMLILEPGVTNVSFNDEVSKVGGTKLNDSLNAINQFNDSLYQLYREKTFPIVQSDLADSIKNKKIDSIAEPIQQQMISFLNASYSSNANNILGAFLFTTITNDATAYQIDSLYNIAGTIVKNHALVKKIMKENEALKNTQPGKPFINFTIPDGNPNGTSVSLSDYVGKGQYVLVDFWASWCGPCRREIPTLKLLYDTYGGNNFQIVSVAVWDKRENSERTIKEMQMTWPQILNAETIPTELYGIQGIPQIILFAPDGTIEARDLRGEKMVELVKEKITQANNN